MRRATMHRLAAGLAVLLLSVSACGGTAASGTAHGSASGQVSASTSGLAGAKQQTYSRASGPSLVDLSWTGSRDGWALAGRPCSAGTCAVLARTSDSGRHWSQPAALPAVIAEQGADCRAANCVTSVRFADSQVGYLFGPSLLMTTDGGRTWRRQAGPDVETLAVVGGTVYRLVYARTGCPGPCHLTLQGARPGSTTWRTVIGSVAFPDRSDSAEIVGSGATVLLAVYGSLAGPMSAQALFYRSADGGATWQRASDPCSVRTDGEWDLGALAYSGGVAAGICSRHGRTGDFVVTSPDGGADWQAGGALPGSASYGELAFLGTAGLAAATGPVSGAGHYLARLATSSDGGATWTTSRSDDEQFEGELPAQLGASTGAAGWWLSGPHRLWTTSDGGLTWKQAATP